MEFTKQFLRAKSPCAMGWRWFVRNVEDGVGYQQALDALVHAGRVDDAVWLLKQFGPGKAMADGLLQSFQFHYGPLSGKTR